MLRGCRICMSMFVRCKGRSAEPVRTPPSRGLSRYAALALVLVGTACGHSVPSLSVGLKPKAPNRFSNTEPRAAKPKSSARFVKGGVLNGGAWLKDGKRLVLTEAGLVLLDPEAPRTMRLVHADVSSIRFYEGSAFFLFERAKLPEVRLWDVQKAAPVDKVFALPSFQEASGNNLNQISSFSGRTVLIHKHGGSDIGDNTVRILSVDKTDPVIVQS
jgi:hypothetical protein